MLELLHYGSLAPSAGALAFRRRLPAGAWWIAGAYAVSWISDTTALLLGGAWYTFYVWLAVQIAFALRAVTETDSEWLAWTAVLAVCASVDVVVLRTGPEVLVTIVGSSVVVTYALLTESRYQTSLILYFGVGSALYLVMFTQMGRASWDAWWAGYQAARVAAWVAFMMTVWRTEEA